MPGQHPPVIPAQAGIQYYPVALPPPPFPHEHLPPAACTSPAASTLSTSAKGMAQSALGVEPRTGDTAPMIILLCIGVISGLAIYLFQQNRPLDLKHQSVVKVRRVLDGKTAIVARGTHCYTIRLEAINAPEAYQQWGDEAAAGFAAMVEGKPVLVEIQSKDRHGRLVATLYVKNRRASEWINVNNQLVASGHAWVYREFYKHLPLQRRQELNRLERSAIAQQAGLWAVAENQAAAPAHPQYDPPAQATPARQAKPG